MKKQSLLLWFVAFVCAALIFTGCPQEADDDDPVLSDKAGLDTGSAVVKDTAVTFTSGEGTFADPIPGTVAVVSTKLNDSDAKTAFKAADNGKVEVDHVPQADVAGYEVGDFAHDDA